MSAKARMFLKRLFEWCGLKIRRTDNEQFFDFEALLWHRMHRSKPFRFIQIGACDGKRFDPIHDFIKANSSTIEGVVVEPLPDLYAALCRTYAACQGIQPINCAIHNSATTMPLHRVRSSSLGTLPEWAIGISSFDRSHLHRLGIPDSAIEEVSVPCQTLAQLIEITGFSSVELLQIDTEGYDAEIILSIDFSSFCPTVIRFEHSRNSQGMPDKTYHQVIDHLHAGGYEVIPVESDAIAFQRSILETSSPAGNLRV